MSPNDILVHCKTSQQVAAASAHPFAGFFWGLVGWITGTVASGLWSAKGIEREREEIAENWEREQAMMRDTRTRYEAALSKINGEVKT